MTKYYHTALRASSSPYIEAGKKVLHYLIYDTLRSCLRDE